MKPIGAETVDCVRSFSRFIKLMKVPLGRLQGVNQRFLWRWIQENLSRTVVSGIKMNGSRVHGTITVHQGC